MKLSRAYLAVWLLCGQGFQAAGSDAQTSLFDAAVDFPDQPVAVVDPGVVKPKLDILLLIDESMTFDPLQQLVGKRVNELVSKLEHIDWQLNRVSATKLCGLDQPIVPSAFQGVPPAEKSVVLNSLLFSGPQPSGARPLNGMDLLATTPPALLTPVWEGTKKQAGSGCDSMSWRRTDAKLGVIFFTDEPTLKPDDPQAVEDFFNSIAKLPLSPGTDFSAFSVSTESLNTGAVCVTAFPNALEGSVAGFVHRVGGVGEAACTEPAQEEAAVNDSAPTEVPKTTLAPPGSLTGAFLRFLQSKPIKKPAS